MTEEKILKEDDPQYVHPGVSVDNKPEDEEDEINNDDEDNISQEIDSSSSKKDELVLILNTGKEGKLDYVTSPIKGELDSIIISTDNIINIRIGLDEYEEIMLYQKQGFNKTKYLSLRNDVSYSNGEIAQNQVAKWKLNDKLRIQVDGSWNTSIKIVIRYS